MDDEFRKTLIEALELIVANMPIGDVDTHRARDKVERLRQMHEAGKEERNG